MKMIIFAVILVTKTKTILFPVISMTKTDDFIRGNLYDEEKDNCLTFFEVCFPLAALRFLCVVLLFLLLFIVLGSKDLGFYVFRTLICIVGKS